MDEDPTMQMFTESQLHQLMQMSQSYDVDRLVAEHREHPFGPHSDELSRILNFVRQAPTKGKLVIVALPIGAGWRLGTITGVRSEGSVHVHDERYDSVAEAEHAALLKRLKYLGLNHFEGSDGAT